MSGLTVDPEFKTLIPPLSAEEYAQLEANIKAEGCREALIVWECLETNAEILIDGHNRYAICQAHGVYYPVAYRHFKDRNAARLWVIDNQLGRRNLNDFVRGELALKKKNLYAEIAKDNQRLSAKTDNEGSPILANPLLTPLDTREKLAEIAGISHGNISKIEKIIQTAAPEVIETARSGEITINAAYKIATGYTPQEQPGIVKVIQEGSPHLPGQKPAKPALAKEDIDKGYSDLNYLQMEDEFTIVLENLLTATKLDIETALLRLGCAQPVASDAGLAIIAVLQKKASEQWAAALLQNLRKNNIGNTIYFSAISQKEQEQRRAQFCAEHDGTNRVELCAKYDISKRTCLRWLAQERQKQ